jgi:hypothetical protein
MSGHAFPVIWVSTRGAFFRIKSVYMFPILLLAFYLPHPVLHVFKNFPAGRYRIRQQAHDVGLEAMSIRTAA